MLLTDNEISDIYEQPSKTPREFARSIEQAVIAKMREQEPIYQVWRIDGNGEFYSWEDCEKSEYENYPELDRRCLFEHPATIPEGWQLAPVEPTDKMLEAIKKRDCDGSPASYTTIYQAMLAAARSE